MRFSLIFGCVFARTYLFKLRYCGFTKLLQKISGNFKEVCGFLILLCAVLVRISVRFCAESHAPSPPLRTPLLSLKFTLLNHNFEVQCNSNYLFFTNLLWYHRCFPAHSNNLHKPLYQSCFRFSLTFFFSFFFAKRELITEADKESCATYNL